MKKLIFFAALIFVGMACKKVNEPLPVTSTGNIVLKDMVICNDRNSLNSRISFDDTNATYIIGDSTKQSSRSSKGTAASSVTIQLVARLDPPVYEGEILQASHVRIADHYAYVTYNTQGPRYLGGVDIVDVSDPAYPQLISSVIFINPETNKGKDVSSVDVKYSPAGSSNTLLWITGTDETRDSAFVEKYQLNSSNQFESGKSVNFSLKGYVGTDVRYFNDKVYVTSGTGGGLTVLNTDMKELNFFNLDNARSVDVNKDFEIGFGGNPGHIYNPGTWDKEIGGATDPDAKSILRLYNKFALVGLGEEGLKSYDISSGSPVSPVSSLPRPAVPAGGSPQDYVTNGVSVTDHGWVYIANGAGGLDVAKIDSNGNLTWMGNVNLGASVNFVEANSEFAFIARGTRGLKICRVTEN